MLTQGCQGVKIDLTKSQANMTADFCSANTNKEIQQFYWVHDRYGLGVMVCKNGHISVIVDQPKNSFGFRGMKLSNQR